MTFTPAIATPRTWFTPARLLVAECGLGSVQGLIHADECERAGEQSEFYGRPGAVIRFSGFEPVWAPLAETARRFNAIPCECWPYPFRWIVTPDDAVHWHVPYGERGAAFAVLARRPGDDGRPVWRPVLWSADREQAERAVEELRTPDLLGRRLDMADLAIVEPAEDIAHPAVCASAFT